MKKWLKIFCGKPVDEVIGTWSSEDGSGWSMISGCRVIFRKDYTGLLTAWGSYPDPNEYGNEIDRLDEVPFGWKRTQKNIISIKVKDEEWTDVLYEIKPYHSYTNGLKLTQLNKSGVWYVFGYQDIFKF